MGEAYEIAAGLIDRHGVPEMRFSFSEAAIWVKNLVGQELGYQQTDNVASAVVRILTNKIIGCEELGAAAEIMRRAAYQQSDPLWGAF